MAKREFSAGGIVFRKEGSGFEVLLIKDAYGRWTWPKGHIDQGESSRDAALREIKEEVGLDKLNIVDKVGQSNYFYRLKGELIFKTVAFFLVEARGEKRLSPQRDEISQASWFKPEAALNTVQYKGARQMLEKAIKLYKEKKQCSR